MKYNFKKIQDAFVFQKTQNSCGIACLCSIMNYFQKDIDEVHLTYLSGTTQNGATLLGLKEAANQIGLASEGYEGIYATSNPVNYRQFYMLSMNMVSHISSFVMGLTTHRVISLSVTRQSE